MSKNRDSISDRLGRSDEAQPTAPAAPELPGGMTVEQALVALAQSQVTTNAALAQIAADRERFLSEERLETERVEKIRRECEKSAQQRTQEAADRKWPDGAGRFRVALLISELGPDPAKPGRQKKQLVPDRAFPEVEINAATAEEARERYRVICGIRSTDQEIRAIPAAAARAAEAALPPPTWEEPDEKVPADLVAAGCVPA